MYVVQVVKLNEAPLVYRVLKRQLVGAGPIAPRPRID